VDILIPVLLAFIAFCLMASSVYIMNDYVDIEQDRQHPKKRFRPLASGAITKAQARGLGAILACAALGLSAYLSRDLLLILLAYGLLNIAYSFRLKHVAIVDVSIIALGFLLRVFAGGLVVGIPVSSWLIVLTFLLAMILGFGKRRGEFVALGGESQTRQSLEGYNLAFIDVSMVFMAAVTVGAYLMYTVSEEVVERIGSEQIYMTTFFVILGILRYLQLALVYQQSESPTGILLKDRFIQILLLFWILAFAYLLYGAA
ncbi:MAG: UbiA prenyltransferase family protein, partial [Bacteroidota bacterium]